MTILFVIFTIIFLICLFLAKGLSESKIEPTESKKSNLEKKSLDITKS